MLSLSRAQVQSPVRELRCHGVAKNDPHKTKKPSQSSLHSSGYGYPYFTGEETGTERLSHSAKVTWPVGVGARVWTCHADSSPENALPGPDGAAASPCRACGLPCLCGHPVSSLEESCPQVRRQIPVGLPSSTP